MTIPTIPPYEPSFKPVPTVTPFTYRDGVTMLKKLDGMVRYINLVIIPFINNNFEALADEVEADIDNMIQLVNEAIDSVINSSVTVQDTVVAGIFEDDASATRVITDALYGAKAAVDSLTALVTTGRLSDTTLHTDFMEAGEAYDKATSDGKYPLKTDVYTKTETDAAYPAKADVYTKTDSDYNFPTDYSPTLKNKTLYTQGDSQGTHDGGATVTFGEVLNTRNGGTLHNECVSSSFWRDTAMRLVGSGSLKTSSDIVLIACGINPAHIYSSDAITRKAEYEATKLAILMNAISQRIEHSAATITGTGWVDYVLANLSAGAGKTSSNASVNGDKGTWAIPGYGSYFGVGYSFRSGLGATGDTGDWKIGATLKLASNRLAPPVTSLEGGGGATSAMNLVPQVIDAPNVNASNISVTFTSGALHDGLTIIDAIYQIMDKPPMIGIILPTYTKAGAGLAVPNNIVDIYRGDIRSAVAYVTAQYSQLRGRVFVVDPHEFGFDPNIHTMPDGLHWNDTAQTLVAKASEHVYSRVETQRNMFESFGIAGFNWPITWPTY